MTRIYTIGTSNRTLDEFIDLLEYYKISLLIDIRRFPTSKFECFKKENLENSLKEEGIDYFYLGKELGGYREEGYKNYIKTKEFKKGLDKLIELAMDRNVALCCSEKFAFKCHRRFVGFILKKFGYEVIHILEKDKVWLPK